DQRFTNDREKSGMLVTKHYDEADDANRGRRCGEKRPKVTLRGERVPRSDWSGAGASRPRLALVDDLRQVDAGRSEVVRIACVNGGEVVGAPGQGAGHALRGAAVAGAGERDS